MKRMYIIYRATLRNILRITQLTHHQLFTSKADHCVTARAVLVSTLLTQGFSEMDIARISGMCQQKVNRLKNALRYRASSLFARTLAEELRATPN